MFDIDTKEIIAAERKLAWVSNTGVRYATAYTLNNAAFVTRSASQREIRRDMILRNQWTARSIVVNRTRVVEISRQAAEIGSTEPYMETQEYGGTERKKGKHGVPIPTTYASGEPEGAKTRRKVVKAGNRLQRIKLAKFRKLGKTKNQQLVVAVALAVKNKQRSLFLSERKGIYRVVGGRYTGRGWPGKAKLKMLHSLEHAAVNIPENPWLRPSSLLGEYSIPMEYEKQLDKQLALALAR